MVDEHEMTSVLSEFARTLIADFPQPGSLDTLIGRIVDVLPATSAGVTLISRGRAPRQIAASNEDALRYETLQTDLREGPCLLAYESGDAVVVPDLLADHRFPRFCSAAVEVGLGAVFTFPLRQGASRIGALDVYRNTAGAFDLADMIAAQTLADVVSACLTVRSRPVRTARVARRSSEELHRSAMETIAEGVYVVGADGEVLVSNAAARRLLTTDSGNLAHLAFLHEDGTPMLPQEHPSAAALRGGPVSDMIVGVVDSCGRHHVLSASSHPLRRTVAGHPWAAVCILNDVTEQREVARVNQASIGIVSHEMRTPLTSIKGALELIAAGANGDLSDSVKQMISIAATNTERLLGLVNGLLDLTRLEVGSGGLAFADADLAGLVRRSVTMMSPVAERRGIEVVLAPPPTPDPIVHVDVDRVIQVITNVLSNAVKFSPRGSAVRIEIDTAPPTDSVTVRVIDHGRGIPTELLEDVFAPFHQVEQHDAQSGAGTGLGLGICRSILDAHGGTIWMEPTPGGGASCAFTLPRRSTGPDCEGLGRPG